MERITDRFGRTLNYVRISVTDRCNFRCRYCMPLEGIPWNPHEKIMKYEDIIFLIEVLVEMGVKKVRFTGGEPLVRKGFSSFLVDLRNHFPELILALTTNGSSLSAHKENLLASNLDSLNISLDTLDQAKFSYITRTGTLEDVLQGISLFSDMERPELKINTVLLKGFNDEEITELIKFCHSNRAILRLIEFMPLDEVWSEQSFI
ncbi:MAG: radical SAM protein, partial [Synergistales bacterium]|nr:radical SAM protein [Synergistales bacterium]